MRNLTLRQLRAVRAVMRHRKISSAAAQLALTAPAVTIQIKEVERELGILLFDRTADGVHPTSAGRAVVEAARMIEERLDELSSDIDAIKGIRKGELTLGIVSTASFFAPRIVAHFMKLYPGISLQLMVGNRAEVIAALEARSVNMVLMGRPPRDLAVRSALIGDHPHVIIAAPDHPLVDETAISKERIAREPFLVREVGSGTRSSLEFFLSDIDDRPDRIGIEMGSNETIKQAVMAGLGIAFISAHVIKLELELRQLAILDVVGTPVHRQWFLVRRADRALAYALATFQDFLVERSSDFLPHFPGTTTAAPTT